MNGKFILLLILVLFPAVFCRSQPSAAKDGAAQNVSPKSGAAIKTTAAYAEILLRKTEREAELEELLLDYKEEFPKVKSLRFEIDLIQKATTKILAVNAADAGKLTTALGKLLVRKIELEVDLWNLRQQFTDEVPEVKRARRKVEIFERAIKEIL